MYKTNIESIVKATGGKLIKQSSKKASVTIISTDTRDIVSGSAFVALKGKNFDGHDFISKALENGANSVLVSDDTKLVQGDYNAILVKDTLKAYQDIAMAKRCALDFKVIGITGSVGKTSTREMVSAALSESFKVHQTRENFNNEIGLPKTILEAPYESEVCIVEMGMRNSSEIHELSMIAKPNIAVITNIGFAHIENLGSQEAIFNAKKEIVDGLRDNGLLILNANDPFLFEYSVNISRTIRTAVVMIEDKIPHNSQFSVRAYNIIHSDSDVVFDVEICENQGISIVLKSVKIPIPGIHNVTNALIGIACGIELSCNFNDIILGLSKYKNVGNRQNILRSNGIILIDDSYNASPESMKAAIVMTASIGKNNRKIAVIGGMLELGDYSKPLHENIGKQCVESDIDIVYTHGIETLSIIEGIKSLLLSRDKEGKKNEMQFEYFETKEALILKLFDIIREGDVILIKASRGYKMETVTAALYDQISSFCK